MNKDLFVLTQIQAEHKEWLDANFKQDEKLTEKHCAYGIAEEVGELMHALRCQEQGIRGDYAKHEADAKDSIGDIFIFMLGLCSMRGWDIQDIIKKTWAQVKQRDWQKNKETGEVE